MNILSTAIIEARALHRVMGYWLPGSLVAWLFLIKLQEPVFFRRLGVPFYWASVEAVLVLAMSLLPLVWWLGRGPAATLWSRRVAKSPALLVAINYLSIVFYGVSVLMVVVLVGFTLDRVSGIPVSPLSPVHSALGALAPLAVLGGLAPGLAEFRVGRTQGILVWLLLSAAVLHWLWPGWVSGEPLAGLVSVLQATAASLLLSLAASLHKHRP